MKERLTGAIILVALLVLLVPELLTGPESREPATPAGADGAQLRSYTIDLQGDGSGQPPPTTAPATAVTDDPVAEATPDPEAASPPVANVSPPVDEAARGQARPMGSGADTSAATSEQQATAGPAAESGKSAESAKAAATSSPSAEDDRPRSAFGPNARSQPEPPASAGKPEAAGSSSTSKAAAAKAEAQKAEAARAEAAKVDAARTAAAKVEAAKAEAARAATAKAEAAKAEAARLAAAKAESAKPVAASKPDGVKAAGSKGWAVQLGVFGSRDNAERLAKQVKGSGFPVLLNESSGKDGKKLYWVRVGPEADQAAATALSTKLKAAGHRDARVVAYP